MQDDDMPDAGRALDGDRQAGGAGGSSGDGSRWVTVPARSVGRLRAGAFVAIGAAAQAIDGVVFAGERGAHPEWFRGPVEDLRELCGLLDVLGWEGAVGEVDVRVDRDAVPRGFSKALRAAVDTVEAEQGGA
jgi:hypothetical protein